MKLLATLALALPLLTASLGAQTPPAGEGTPPPAAATPAVTPTPAVADEKSLAVLRPMAEFFARAEAVHLRVEFASKVNGEALEGQTSQLEVSVARPNLLARTITHNGETSEILVSDGKNRSLWFAEAKAWEEKKAPADLDTLLEKDSIGYAALYAPLLRDNNLERLLEPFASLRYVREEEKDGAKLAVIAFERREGEGEMVVRTGAQPVPERISIRPRQMGMSFEFTFSDWKFGPDVDAKVFEFRAPEGAKKVRSIAREMAQAEGGLPLLGEKAPDFLLPDLDGKDVKLADYKDKIVILDFWATWCGPCRKGMPILAEVASSYRDKGVVLHAVNLREKKDVVKDFSGRMKHPIYPLLDKDGKVGEKYQVDGIPHTVIIGRDGRIQVVHVGLSPNYEDELREDLDALLAGEDLAAGS